MIAFVRGILHSLEEDNVVVDCGQIGYRVFVPTITITHQQGQEIFLHTYQHVKEDGITLYGFIEKKQLDVFKKCITVSGIGPKSGLGIINQLSITEILTGIQSEDYTIFTKVSGIGKKTAQRLVLELKDKFKEETLIQTTQKASSTGASNVVNQALEGLIGLGYKRNEVEQIVKNMANSGAADVSEIIKLVLKEKGLGGR
ncbi:Holliday junction branch migration protein RuvA [Alkalicella caledoniensis]|uniref:Holliday junction branch migration complex subunit RuvA n=1 Tax=Alkalicella caledoniensis TaxID=2731377 RepID=A0A7G9WAK9_ALKCA|nr:Holliday junction branch migration protein RuvA [Alkalicella caledoniensis]QNO15721.1 Holliday junction branch migration protein RuvA [Alkalicella caledoniensis]